MTAEQVAGLGPAFTQYLRCFRSCFVTHNTFAHLGTYCRGLLSDLARKSVEPIALASGCAVRTLQEFLTHHVWDQDALLTQTQRRIVTEHLPAQLPATAGRYTQHLRDPSSGLAAASQKTQRERLGGGLPFNAWRNAASLIAMHRRIR